MSNGYPAYHGHPSHSHYGVYDPNLGAMVVAPPYPNAAVFGPVNTFDPSSPTVLRGMIQSRLHWTSVPWPLFEVVKDGDVVHVVLLKDGEIVAIKDGWDLFPSDTLITQLRVLKG